MTGFASKSVILNVPGSGKVALFIEIKTINSRFFETMCKLPNALSALEVRIINLLQKQLGRGRVYITVRFAEENESFEELTPSFKNIKGYLDAARTIKKQYKISGELSIADLFQLPNIFVPTQNVISSKEEEAVLRMIEEVTHL